MEALRLLEEIPDRFWRESHENLRTMVDGGPFVEERKAGGARDYQIEVVWLWDGGLGGNVLVMGSIDDGGWRAFAPLTRSFIMAPDGRFVGE